MNLVACEISLPPYSLSQGFPPGETSPAARSEKRGETVDFAGYESCDKCQRKNICFSSRVSCGRLVKEERELQFLMASLVHHVAKSLLNP